MEKESKEKKRCPKCGRFVGNREDLAAEVETLRQSNALMEAELKLLRKQYEKADKGWLEARLEIERLHERNIFERLFDL